VALGQTIGRIGCFMAGCCYGRSCDRPWAVTFTDPRAYELTGVPLGTPLHPAQLYHAAADALILGVTLFMMPRRRTPGQVFWVYVLAYAALRFVVEFFRGDTVRGLHLGGTLSTSQVAALPAAIVALLMLRRLARSPSAAGSKGRTP
jgi:phosphatidylglycerol:prolipoprotein diacylglycerol transferase